MSAAEGLIGADWDRHPPEAKAMDRLGRTFNGAPTVRGNTFEMIGDTEDILRRIAQDIDGATSSLLMEFYIWNAGGAAELVLDAVMRAARRGVACRLLIDALGARPW